MLYRIHESHMAGLEKKIAKLNKIAANIGGIPILFEVVGDEWDKLPDGMATKYLFVEVQGFAPKLNGWSFVAVITHLPESVNYVQKLPGKDLPDDYWVRPPLCEHCNKHRKRNETFVVEKEGDMVQVGRSCLAAFTGYPDPESVASWAEALGHLHTLCMAGGQHETKDFKYIHLETYLASVAAAIRLYGWVSKDKATFQKKATADCAFALLKQKPTGVAVTATDMAEAQAAILWAEDIPLSGTTDFQKKIRNLSIAGVFEYQMRYVAASILIAHKIQLNDKKEQTPMKLSQHLHAAGEKVTVTLSVKIAMPIADQSCCFYVLEDKDGNVYKWTSSGKWLLSKGNSYTLDATVKENTVYKGIKQTVLTYCKEHTSAENGTV